MQKQLFFFSKAANDETQHFATAIKAWDSNNNECDIVIGGTAVSTEKQAQAQGVYKEQQACKKVGIVHGADRWCIKPKMSLITGLWIIEEKEITTSEEEA